MSGGWSMQQIVDLLCSLDPGTGTMAMLGRIHRWQATGAIETAGGRGKRNARYSRMTVWRAAMLNEMAILGVSPENAKRLLDGAGVEHVFDDGRCVAMDLAPTPAGSILSINIEHLALAIAARQPS